MADDDTNSSTDDGQDADTGEEHDDPAAGGEPGDGGGEGDGGADAGEDTWTPPSKEEWEKLTRTAEARKEDVRKLRAAARAKKAAPAKKPASAPAAKPEDSDSGDQAEPVPDDRWKVTAARQSVAAALLEAGFTGDRKAAKDLARTIHLDDVEVDDEGDVNDADIEDVVEQLKTKYAGMFTPATGGQDQKPPPPRRPTTADKGGRDRRPPAADASKRMSQSLRRQAGYR